MKLTESLEGKFVVALIDPVTKEIVLGDIAAEPSRVFEWIQEHLEFGRMAFAVPAKYAEFMNPGSVITEEDFINSGFRAERARRNSDDR